MKIICFIKWHDGTDIFADYQRCGDGSLAPWSLGGINYTQLICIKLCKMPEFGRTLNGRHRLVD